MASWDFKQPTNQAANNPSGVELRGTSQTVCEAATEEGCAVFVWPVVPGPLLRCTDLGFGFHLQLAL